MAEKRTVVWGDFRVHIKLQGGRIVPPYLLVLVGSVVAAGGNGWGVSGAISAGCFEVTSKKRDSKKRLEFLGG